MRRLFLDAGLLKDSLARVIFARGKPDAGNNGCGEISIASEALRLALMRFYGIRKCVRGFDRLGVWLHWL